MNLEADQMNALFDYTRESMAADSVISATDEQDILEAQERWELAKLKKKYERVAEKDEC